MNGHRVRRKSPMNTKAGAQAFEATLRMRLAQGEALKKAARQIPTFEAVAKEWMSTHVTRATHSPRGIELKESTLRNHLLPFFGRRRIDRIRTRLIDQFTAHQGRRGYAPKTINNHLTILRRLLQVAMEWDYIDDVPKVRKLKTTPAVMDFYHEDEVRDLLLDYSEPTYNAMVRTGLRTGMRFGEIAALEWDCVSFDDDVIHVRRNRTGRHVGVPKSKRFRDIPMTRDLRNFLRRNARREGLVFPSARGAYRSYTGCQKALKRLCERAGVRYLGWHGLRHTYATQLVRRGVDIHAVSRLLGHSSILMTEKYLHVLASTLQGVVDKLLVSPEEAKWQQGVYDLKRRKLSTEKRYERNAITPIPIG